MNTHRITHNASGHKEEVSKETIESLTKARLIKNYKVEELKAAKRPSEDLTEDAPKNPKSTAAK